MRKFFTFLGLVSFSILGLNTNASAQVEKGNFIIDPYYGFPNFGKSLVSSTGVDNGVVTGIGPAGIRLEYMVADKFGLGVDFIYNSTNIEGTVDSLNSDGTVYDTYDLKVYAQRYRVHFRANYHFVQNDNVDAYLGVGAGTNIRRIGYTTDYPNYDGDNATGALIPFSMRLALGTRYYFTDNIGLNAEIGIGGPVVSAGLSFKF